VIAEIAVATHTHPGPWWDEPEEMVLTVLEIFEDQAAQVEAKKRTRKRR
jgi:hypothetical protein